VGLHIREDEENIGIVGLSIEQNAGAAGGSTCVYEGVAATVVGVYFEVLQVGLSGGFFYLLSDSIILFGVGIMGSGADEDSHEGSILDCLKEGGVEVVGRPVSGAIFGKDAKAFARDVPLKIVEFGFCEGLADERRVIRRWAALPRSDDLLNVFRGNLQCDAAFAVVKVYFHTCKQPQSI
jgi:hypothetical protein